MDEDHQEGVVDKEEISNDDSASSLLMEEVAHCGVHAVESVA